MRQRPQQNNNWNQQFQSQFQPQFQRQNSMPQSQSQFRSNSNWQPQSRRRNMCICDGGVDPVCTNEGTERNECLAMCQ